MSRGKNYSNSNPKYFPLNIYYFQVEVQVPIKVCKSVDPNREPIINREIAGTESRQPGRRPGSLLL